MTLNRYGLAVIVFGICLIQLSCSPVNPSTLTGWYERKTDSNSEKIQLFSYDSSFDYSMESEVCCSMVVTGKWIPKGSNDIRLIGNYGYTADLPPGPYKVEENLDESIIGYQFRFVLDDFLLEAPIQVFFHDDTVSTTTTTGVLTVDLPSLTRFRVYSDFNHMRAYEHQVTKYGSNVFIVRFAFSKYPCDSLSFTYRMKYRRKRLYQVSEDGTVLDRKPFKLLKLKDY